MQEQIRRLEENQTSFMDEMRRFMTGQSAGSSTIHGPQPSSDTAPAVGPQPPPTSAAAGRAAVTRPVNPATQGPTSATTQAPQGPGETPVPGNVRPPPESPASAAHSYAPLGEAHQPTSYRYAVPPEARYDPRYNRTPAGPATTANAQFQEPLGTPFVPHAAPSIFGYPAGPRMPPREFNSNIKPIQPKHEDIGSLEPDTPESFILRLRANMVRFSDQESNLVAVIHRAMVQSNNLTVRAWYTTLVAMDAGGNVAIRERLRSVEGWIDLINFKFARSMVQRAQALQSIRFSWDEPIDIFCARIIQACVEAGKAAEDHYIVEICSRLPAELLNGLAPGRFTTVAELERELRINEVYARRIHYRMFSRDDRSGPYGKSPYPVKRTDDKKADDRKASDGRNPPNLTNRQRPFETRAYPNVQGGHSSSATRATSQHVHFGHAETEDGERTELSSSESEDRHESSPQDSPSTTASSPQDDSRIWYFTVDDESTQTYHAVSSPATPVPNILSCRPLGQNSLQPGGYLDYSIVQMPVATTSEGETFWRMIDTGAGMSLASRKWLDANVPDAEVNRLDTPIALTGVVPNQRLVIKDVAKVDLFIPVDAASPTRVHVAVLFYVVDSLAPGILLGPDFLVPYKIQLDLEARKLTIGSCNPRAQGDLKCTPTRKAKLGKSQTVLVGTTSDEDVTPFANVQAVTSVGPTVLEPGLTTRIHVAFPSESPRISFFDGAILDNDGEVRSANAVINTDDRYVLATNFSSANVFSSTWRNSRLRVFLRQ